MLMYLKNITISNFRAIENMQMKFQKGFNILIGDNGVGKTSILEAISVALGGFLAGIDGIKTKHFTNEEIRCVSELLGQGSYNIKYITPVQVDCDIELNGENYNWTRKKSSIKAARSTVEPRDICKKASKISQDSSGILPLLNYQSVSRMWAQKKEKAENVFKRDDFSRNVGYIDCLSQESNIKMLLNWCKRMEQISWQQEHKIAEYEAVKNALSKFMSIMDNRNITNVIYDKRQEELMYKDGDKILPIRFLSAGYQSLIWMVLEIAYRMAVLNPNLLENVTCKTTGIVLIDELDLHLHPKWQWKVVTALKETFPSAQFIATTHSPIILASCKNERVISIDANMNIEYRNSLYGLPVNDVLSTYQDSDSIVSNIKAKLAEFYKALDTKEFTKASQILKELSGELGEDNPEIVGAKMTLDLETMQLEE